MPVPIRNRSEHTLTVIEKTQDLLEKVIRVVKNQKVVPLRYFQVLGVPLVDSVRTFYVELSLANHLRSDKDFEQAKRRIEKFKEAQMKFYEVDANLMFVEKWTHESAPHLKEILGLIHDVRRLLGSLLNSEEDKLKRRFPKEAKTNDPFSLQSILQRNDSELEKPEKKFFPKKDLLGIKAAVMNADLDFEEEFDGK